MNFEPTQEEWEAWRYIQHFGGHAQMPQVVMADAYLRCLAAVMEADFKLNHSQDYSRRMDYMWCHGCNAMEYDKDYSESHQWDSARWLDAARKRLEQL